MHAVVEKLAMRMSVPVSTGARCLLAVSGGADSVAMLRGCLALPGRVPEFHVAHLNHQLRGAASQADALWLRATCDRLNVPVTMGEIDVSAEARSEGIGIEEAARDARYRFLRETALCHGCNSVATAHTADDQAETILHHLLRGTGIAGLRGISSTRELEGGVRLVRPFLDVTRSEVLDYLVSLGQDFCVDASNADESLTRNRIRRQLIPQLSAEYNPHLAAALVRLGQQAREVHETIEILANELLGDALNESSPDECTLHWKRLLGHPRHLVREAFTQLWRRQNWPRQKMDFDHWNRLVETAWHGGAITLPSRIDARHAGLLLVLRKMPTDSKFNSSITQELQ